MVIALHPAVPDDEIVDGVPDLRGTRLLCFGATLPCLAFAIWLPVAIASADVESASAGLVIVLVLAVVALAAFLSFILVRAGLHPGAWCRVGADGIHYGDGRREDSAGRAASAAILWSRIVANPERTYDVGTSTQLYGVAPNPRLTFWYRREDGAIVERVLSLQFRNDVLRCLRFRNVHALRVAVLQRLASNAGLRFHPDVFVSAGVDPETWQPMPAPRRASWVAASVIVGCMLAFAGLTRDPWSPALLAGGAALIFTGGVALHVANWNRKNRRLTGIITFEPSSRPDAPAPAPRPARG